MSSLRFRTNLYLLAVVAMLCFFTASSLCAGIVTISTSTANGTSGVPNSDDFIGVLTADSPPAIGATLLNFNGPLPNGEAFMVGDLVGRDVDASGGLRVWSYDLLLPNDAATGFGLESINFDAHAFERRVNNLETDDELIWELFLNGTLVTSGSTGGNDFGVFDLNLFDAGGPLITQATVRFTANGFNASNEWFATRGLLSASYNQAIPEPGIRYWLLLLATGTILRRRKA